DAIFRRHDRGGVRQGPCDFRAHRPPGTAPGSGVAAQGAGRMNDRVQDLFHEVADLAPESRARYFAERGIPPEAQREVEGLLAFDSGASAYLEQAIGDAAALAMARLDIRDQRCGPYRLLERIGQGGMGAVYLAERDDGDVTQRVAIKLLHPGSADPWRR